MVNWVIVIDEKHVRLGYANVWNIKWSWWIYNELQSFEGQSAYKEMGRWHLVTNEGVQRVGWEGFKVRFSDVVALKWQISWLCKMVSTAFCILLDLSINLLILNGCPWVIAWLFGTLWCWGYTDLKMCCFVWLQRNTEKKLHVARSKSHVSRLRMKCRF